MSKLKSKSQILNLKQKLETTKYVPSEIEKRWQKVWEENRVYQPDLDKAKKPFYNLMMFPYPSAEGMHVGNMYAFTGADVYGRFMRMQGYDVFEPIGLDGFGIHSENYAIKVGRHPKEQAKISEKNFYRQLRSSGNGFDWSRKLETYDPSYYRWTQWLFIQFFKAGLAYRKKAPVNFCPSCKTVLADEQVIQKVRVRKDVILNSFQDLNRTEIPKQVRNDNEEVQHDRREETIGVCERCETPVEKKELDQWFFRITKYVDRLLENIAKLDWSEKVKIAQRNWIGRSEGALISFVILNSVQDLGSSGNEMPKPSNSAGRQVRHDTKKIEVFTTRPDTLYGATFLVLSPEHSIITEILKDSSFTRRPLAKLKQIGDYVQKAKKKTEQERVAEGKEKTGIFTGLYAINPLNNEKIPVWIADYAVMDYGTGALFGDAHDERDFAFAKKHGIPLTPTIVTGNKEQSEKIMKLEECYTGYGTLVDSGEFSGLTSKEAMKRVMRFLEDNGKGKTASTYHLRDWLISRQRYWGPPIPMVFCQSCAKKGSSGFTLTKKSPSKEDYLVNLKADSLSGWPDTLEGNISKQNKNVNSEFKKGLDSPGVEPGRFGVSSQPSRPAEPTPESVYRKDNEFVNDWNSVGWFPVPEKDLPVLLPKVKDWKPTGTSKSPLANVESFVNTKCPNCKGPAKRETDVSDTFLDSAWYFFRYTSTDIESSIFDIKRVNKWLPVKMYIGGAEHSVLHLLYSRFITMALYDLGFINFDEPFSRFYAHGLLIKEKAKMSKSKGNVVIPDDYIKKFGIDTLRCYLMFLGPFSQGGDFYDTGMEGMSRFIRRVLSLVSSIKYQVLSRNSQSLELDRAMSKTIKQVTDDLGRLRYNTAIAHIMEYYNSLHDFYTKYKLLNTKYCKTLVLLLSPFAPHMTEELWQRLGVPRGGRVPQVSRGGSTRGTRDTFATRDTFNSIHLQPWPTYDPKLLEEDEVTIVVQVNGKVRDTIKHQKSIPDSIGDKNQKYIERLAKESDKVKKHLGGKNIERVVYVEGKIINFVAK